MAADFGLGKKELYDVTNTYSKNIEQAQNAFTDYNQKIDEILGQGWKGSASNEFVNTISEYQKTIKRIVVKLEQYQKIFEHAGTKCGGLIKQGCSVGDQMKYLER